MVAVQETAPIISVEGPSQPVDPGRADVENALVVGMGGKLSEEVDPTATHKAAVERVAGLAEAADADA